MGCGLAVDEAAVGRGSSGWHYSRWWGTTNRPTKSTDRSTNVQVNLGPDESDQMCQVRNRQDVPWKPSRSAFSRNWRYGSPTVDKTQPI